MNRRHFVVRGGVALASCLGALRSQASAVPKRWGSLIPNVPNQAPNYWCTWAAQNYMYGHHIQHLEPQILEGDSGAQLARDAMSENVLFGSQGWTTHLFPRIRQDLYLMLDDGWESGGSATFMLDTAKFPSFPGTPTERLSQLNNSVRKAGWRSTALWCRHTPGGQRDEQLEILSQAAGVNYWKVDIGDPDFYLIRLRNRYHTPILFEHVHAEPPVNGDWRKDGRFGAQPWRSFRQEVLAHTDVYRTYDVTSSLSLPTTLDRMAEMLKGAQGHPVQTLLNVEDEVYVAAVMGCTMGILRHPLVGLRPGQDVDLFFNGPRHTKRRMDEVVRALRWQRIAPPFPARLGSVHLSDEVLTDSWTFERGQTWQSDLVGETVYQGAPACISRNISLPRVSAIGDKPYVFASRFPNGAVAIGAQERTRVGRAWYMPQSDVELHVGDAPGPYGIFGSFASLTLTFDKSLRGRRIVVQDLAGDESIDVTGHIQASERALHLSEANLRSFGLSAASKGDLSSPGLVLALR